MRLLLSSVHWRQDLAQNWKRLLTQTVPTLQQGRWHVQPSSSVSTSSGLNKLFLSMALC